jgi:hypothetical protein
MEVQKQINQYIQSLPIQKQEEMQQLHDRFIILMPKGRLWFEDGKDQTGKIVSNPNIGYGEITMHLAQGKTRVNFHVGLSANSTGISIYILGLKDKNLLTQLAGDTLGKAKITGYCIKFKTLKDIHLPTLEHIIHHCTAE